jgi:hypothetical protein
MFGIRIIKEKEYQELKTKLNGLSSLEQVLEKQEKYIRFVADSTFEGKYNELIINEKVNLLNKINQVKKESDFIKLTVLELLDVIKQTEIVKKDKKLVKVFDEVMMVIKRKLNILKEDKDIKEK